MFEHTHIFRSCDWIRLEIMAVITGVFHHKLQLYLGLLDKHIYIFTQLGINQ